MKYLIPVCLVAGLMACFIQNDNLPAISTSAKTESLIHFASQSGLDLNEGMGASGQSTGTHKVIRPSLLNLYNEFSFHQSTESVSFELVPKQELPIQLSLYDLGGSILYKTEFQLKTGKNLIPLNTNHLRRGIYFCKTSSNGREKIEKFLKF